jgi:alpha-L-fucosidase
VQDQQYKAAGDIICDLLDIVSKNGSLLLNVGPKADGTIPEAEQQILLEIGRWLEINGEAIYSTRPWHMYGEGPTDVPDGSFTDTKRSPFTGQDVRFTQKDNVLYAALLAWPGKQAVIRALGRDSALPGDAIRRVSLLGGPQDLSWQQDESGLHVALPDQPVGEHAWVLRIEQSRNA